MDGLGETKYLMKCHLFKKLPIFPCLLLFQLMIVVTKAPMTPPLTIGDEARSWYQGLLVLVDIRSYYCSSGSMKHIITSLEVII